MFPVSAIVGAAATASQQANRKPAQRIQYVQNAMQNRRKPQMQQAVTQAAQAQTKPVARTLPNGAATGGAPAPLAPPPEAKRFQGMDPALAAQRYAQFKANQLPGQQVQGAGGAMAPSGGMQLSGGRMPAPAPGSQPSYGGGQGMENPNAGASQLSQVAPPPPGGGLGGAGGAMSPGAMSSLQQALHGAQGRMGGGAPPQLQGPPMQGLQGAAQPDIRGPITGLQSPGAMEAITGRAMQAGGGNMPMGAQLPPNVVQMLQRGQGQLGGPQGMNEMISDQPQIGGGYMPPPQGGAQGGLAATHPGYANLQGLDRFYRF